MKVQQTSYAKVFTLSFFAITAIGLVLFAQAVDLARTAECRTQRLMDSYGIADSSSSEYWQDIEGVEGLSWHMDWDSFVKGLVHNSTTNDDRSASMMLGETATKPTTRTQTL